MTNPYGPSDPNIEKTTDPLATPALCLVIIASIAIACGIFGLVTDGILIATGMDQQLEEMQNRPISKRTQILIRSIWGVVLIVASAFVLYGGLQMRKRSNYKLSRFAALVAAIPCVGPCCLLGIPFGIWAFVVLGKPEVRQSFR